MAIKDIIGPGIGPSEIAFIVTRGLLAGVVPHAVTDDIVYRRMFAADETYRRETTAEATYGRADERR